MTEFSKFAWLKATEGYKLTAFEHDVLKHICNKADGKTGCNAYVTESSLAARYQRSERQARRALAKLRDLGIVDRTRKGTKDGGPSIYRLTMPIQPDIPTGHGDDFQPDMGDPTGHAVTDPTGHGVSGISDPIIRSPKGSDSKESDLPDTEVSGVVASLAVGEGRKESEPSPWGSDSAIEGSDPQESEPSEDVSSSYQPDTSVVSGISNRTSGMSGDPQPSTGSEAMRDRFDPWAAAAESRDSSAPQPTTDDDYYGEMYEAHLAAQRPQPVIEPFKLGPGTFIGPDTDPLTGGPNWAQGPTQRP